MNIRTRLHISNIVMIVVAACIACLVGLACIASIWFVITGGAPFESEVMSAYLVSWGFSGFNIDVLKTTIITACLILLFVILVTVVITDQVMTRFVIRYITAPLDCLSAGVEEIRTGNLDYRINYQEPDEFKPVCDAFDEMAQRLASSVERDRRGEDARKELFSAMSHDLR
ncbi:MAG: HAMP domain-containing protein, partial [Eggerthellaceae bacterium]